MIARPSAEHFKKLENFLFLILKSQWTDTEQHKFSSHRKPNKGHMCLTIIVYLCFSKKRLRDAYDKSCDQFRLHNEEDSSERQSRKVNQINKMFEPKSESQRPENVTQCNGNEYSEIG